MLAMTAASSWAEQVVPLAPGTPHLIVLDAARRDAQWGVWVAEQGRFLGGRIRDRGAAEQLAPSLAQGLEAAALSLSDIGAIVVGIGPGSYAGLRIALSFAKGLAAGSGKPLIAVPSLEGLLLDAPGAHD